MAGRILIIFSIILGALAVPGVALAVDTPSVEQRLAELEGREAIRTLMKQYGRTLDTRNFKAFGELFAKDGVYVSGGQRVEGPEKIAAMLKGIFASNPSGIREPNFHVFFNEVITFTGPGEAKAFSQSAYVAPGEDNAPKMIFFASYDDTFVIEDGQWKFKERIVHGDIPAPKK